MDPFFAQVSRYIDASMAELGRGAVEDIDRTYGVLLEEGESPENVSFALQPPIANQEEFISRPESSISRSDLVMFPDPLVRWGPQRGDPDEVRPWEVFVWGRR